MAEGITAKRLLRTGGPMLLALLIAAYGIWQGRDLLFGIRLRVEGISDGMRAASPVLALSGVARHGSGMTVNGRFVPVAESGAWSDTIALLPGTNVITLAAADKFKRQRTRAYTVFYSSEAPISS